VSPYFITSQSSLAEAILTLAFNNLPFDRVTYRLAQVPDAPAIRRVEVLNPGQRILVYQR
jgi:hypothetical protein